MYNGWDQMLNAGTNDIPKHVGFRLQRKARNPEQPAVCPICSPCKAPDKPEGTSANPIKPARPHPEREGGEAEAGKDIGVLSKGLRRGLLKHSSSVISSSRAFIKQPSSATIAAMHLFKF